MADRDRNLCALAADDAVFDSLPKRQIGVTLDPKIIDAAVRRVYKIEEKTELIALFFHAADHIGIACFRKNHIKAGVLNQRKRVKFRDSGKASCRDAKISAHRKLSFFA